MSETCESQVEVFAEKVIAGRETIEHRSLTEERHHRAAHCNEARPDDHRRMRRYDLVEQLHGHLRARLIIVENEAHVLAADAALCIDDVRLEIEDFLLTAGEEGAIAGQRQDRIDAVSDAVAEIGFEPTHTVPLFFFD